MDSMPWYLLAAGIGLVIVGFLIASLPGRSGQGEKRRRLNPRMRDDDIVRELKRTERMPLPSLMILAGLLCILVSIGWRLARTFF